MLIAKVAALLGLAMLVGGASGSVADFAVPVGAVVLLIAATIGAVVLEDRDLDAAAGLVAPRSDERDAPLVELVNATRPLDEPEMRSAA